ncbi:hypothetical protein [Roseateles noduli]
MNALDSAALSRRSVAVRLGVRLAGDGTVSRGASLWAARTGD